MALMDNLNSKEAAYMLGFIWGDGWVRKTKYHREVRVECLREDIEEIKPYLDKVFDWKIYYRNRSNRRPQARLNLTHLEFVDYLLKNGYSTERDGSKALSIISEDLRPLWFRGLIDADGCWYVNEELRKKQFNISAALNQDWIFFERLLNTLDLKYNVRKSMSNNGNSSRIEMFRKADIVKLGEYVYSSFKEDKIGLQRKYDKWIRILNF